jgi:iron complex transport system ATP-binding protein
VTRLEARGASFGYGDRVVVRELDLAVPDAGLTVLVGPNACGKSTLLRGMARMLRPRAGGVFLDGTAIHHEPTRAVARALGMLPQSPTAPEEITVLDLVSRGRQPHQHWWSSWSAEDEAAVRTAMDQASVEHLADVHVDALSGGQRQRVWIAMALAQQTDLLLLDEPTTYLDIAHQIEVLDLMRSMADAGRTVVAVLHDLNQAARYADHVVALREGGVVAAGAPAEVVTEQLVDEVFGVTSMVVACPATGSPLVVPH